jgi:hypothetical protein
MKNTTHRIGKLRKIHKINKIYEEVYDKHNEQS